jgi:hypothetical protein
MGSVSTINPALANLLQTLSGIDPQALSNPSVKTALQNASPTDIVELSAAAQQLQSVDSLFGIPDAAGTSTSGLGDISSLASLTSGDASSSSSGSALLDAFSNSTPEAQQSALLNLLV